MFILLNIVERLILLCQKQFIMKILYTTFLVLFSLASKLNAQSELTINCYPANTPFNSFSLNNDVVEYGLCGAEPAFYVAVFDPATCSAWESEYNGANEDHDFGNFNSSDACRLRPEKYFIFRYADTNQLIGMNNMITQIPAGFPYVIYTPISYNYTQINGVCPSLTQTLASNWDPAVIQDNHIMVLFGVQGQSATYAEDTVTNGGDHISFTTTICDVTGLNEVIFATPTVSYLGNDQFTITATTPVQDVQLMSLTGERIPAVLFEETTLYSTKPLAKGIYFVRGTMNGREWSQKVAVY